MGRSRRAAATLACVVGASACNALVGLNGFHDVPCDGGCDGGTGVEFPEDTGALEAAPPFGSEAGPDATTDATTDATLNDASADAPPEGSGFQASEAGNPVDLRWPRWPMPNGGAPDSGLPNPAKYTLVSGTDGGVFDTVTRLSWGNVTNGVTTLTAAESACAPPWRLPTRIELVSILDTSNPADSGVLANAAFAQMPPVRAWTASATPSGAPWTVDFGAGTVAPGGAASAVICIYVGDDGGAP